MLTNRCADLARRWRDQDPAFHGDLEMPVMPVCKALRSGAPARGKGLEYGLTQRQNSSPGLAVDFTPQALWNFPRKPPRVD